MSKVEVYEVGFEQLRGMLDSSCLGDCATDSEPLALGCYVLVECACCFDYVQRPRIAHVFYCESHVRMVASLFDTSAREHCELFAHEYEVWHVCDDDDLWQAWEHEVWIARMLDGGMYDKVYVLPSGTEDAGIETQRKASACRISLDNGHTFLDPVRDDFDLQELIVFLDTYPHIWDLIVSGYMDDETREFTHLTSSYTGMLPDEHTSTAMINACWLCDYLMNADSDLIY